MVKTQNIKTGSQKQDVSQKVSVVVNNILDGVRIKKTKGNRRYITVGKKRRRLYTNKSNAEIVKILRSFARRLAKTLQQKNIPASESNVSSSLLPLMASSSQTQGMFLRDVEGVKRDIKAIRSDLIEREFAQEREARSKKEQLIKEITALSNRLVTYGVPQPAGYLERLNSKPISVLEVEKSDLEKLMRKTVGKGKAPAPPIPPKPAPKPSGPPVPPPAPPPPAPKPPKGPPKGREQRLEARRKQQLINDILTAQKRAGIDGVYTSENLFELSVAELENIIEEQFSQEGTGPDLEEMMDARRGEFDQYRRIFTANRNAWGFLDQGYLGNYIDLIQRIYNGQISATPQQFDNAYRNMRELFNRGDVKEEPQIGMGKKDVSTRIPEIEELRNIVNSSVKIDPTTKNNMLRWLRNAEEIARSGNDPTDQFESLLDLVYTGLEIFKEEEEMDQEGGAVGIPEDASDEIKLALEKYYDMRPDLYNQNTAQWSASDLRKLRRIDREIQRMISGHYMWDNESFMLDIKDMEQLYTSAFGEMTDEQAGAGKGTEFDKLVSIYKANRGKVSKEKQEIVDGLIERMKKVLADETPPMMVIDTGLDTLYDLLEELNIPRGQEGGGEVGLTTDEVAEIMGDKDPAFCGVMALDQLAKFQPFRAGKRGIVSFIVNTKPIAIKFGHWVAVRIDDKKNDVEFYDPYGQPPSKQMRAQILRLVKGLRRSMGFDGKFQFKINRIRHQGDSNRCGFFAAKFLIDRARGKTFREATEWDEIQSQMEGAGEKVIERFMKKVGDFGVI